MGAKENGGGGILKKGGSTRRFTSGMVWKHGLTRVGVGQLFGKRVRDEGDGGEGSVA